MSQQLMKSLAQPVNHAAQAYEARTNQLTQQREADEAKAAAAQQQRDNDMLKVFEFAGDGRTEEAKYLAQAKGLEVPEQIYQNGDFAKGLATAGNFYGDDPSGAQRFTMAWMQTRDIPDYAQRVIRTSQIAGSPIDPEDRKFQQQLRLEQFKSDLKSQGRREDLFIDTTKEAFGNFALTPDEMKGAGSGALESYDAAFPRTGQGQPSAGLVNYGAGGVANQPLSVRNNNPGNMRPVGATTGFQQFASPQEGMQAMRNDLSLKISGQSQAMSDRFGANYNPTLAAVISTWAPPEENDTGAYVNFVSQQTGIQPNQTLSLQDIDRIMPAMIQMEGGQQAANYYGNAGQQTSSQPQLPSGLPQGSVMIGTANGRPVYQAPNGERFIDDGNPQIRQ